MKARTLHRETLIKRPIEEVFTFFSQPANLQSITPPQFGMRILTPQPVEIKKGTIIDYKIKVSGIWVNWRTEITVWEPFMRFVDVQAKGPYELWIHEHRFMKHPDGTIMHDDVRFISPGLILEPLVHRLFVKRQLDHLFNYRSERFKQLFP